jgi:Fe-Mn family superoxide dismutase
MDITRRHFLTSIGMAPVAGFIIGQAGETIAQEQTSPPPSGPYTLPDLGFTPDALEPHLDAMTMTIHHGKHHGAYVKNANAALKDHPDLAKLPLNELLRTIDSVPDSVRTVLRNNAGGHANHSLFWKILSPTPKKAPEGPLARKIDETFSGLEGFKEQFGTAATKVFGSGWAWLSLTPSGTLVIETTPNQDSPLMKGNTPVLGLDVWEHAYYLRFQNRRAEYITAFWNVADWAQAEKTFETALPAS